MSLDRHRYLFFIWALILASTALPAVAEEPVDRTAGYHAVDDQLRMLLGLLFEDNPQIERAAFRAAAQAERAAQVVALPDPTLSYRFFGGQPETRVGPQRQSLEISQRLPGLGKRDLDRQYAERLTDAWNSHLTHEEREQVAMLKRAYFEAAYLQEALAIKADESEMLRRFESVALKRYSTGGGIQQSVIKIQTALTRLDDRKIALANRLDAHHHHIARMVSRPHYTIPLQPIRLVPAVVENSPEDLESQALESNPRIRAAASQTDAGANRVKRSSAAGHPDFSVALGFTEVGRRDDAGAQMVSIEDDGRDIWSIGASVSIPLHRTKIRAGIAEADHALQADRQELRMIQDRVRHDVQGALLRFDSLHERLELYQQVLIPQAEESLGSAEAAYATDRMDVLDLLDAQRVLFESRLTYYRLLTDSWITLTDIEELVAIPYPPLAEDQS